MRVKHGNVSLYKTVVIFIDRVADNQILERAYGVAFNFTLSLFPSIIFLFAMLPFIESWIPSISLNEVMHYLYDILPRSLFLEIAPTIRDLLQTKREGLISFGALFALFLATNGVNSLMTTFNMSYKTVENRSFLKTRFIALFLTVLLAVAFLTAILLLVVGEFVVDWMLEFSHISHDFANYFLLPLRILVILSAFYGAVASIYYWGPAIHDKWRFFSLGSFIATILCLIVSLGFSFYISKFGTYNKIYGSIGGIIALMVWQYLMSAILLLGFEFNASIDRAGSDYSEDLEKD